MSHAEKECSEPSSQAGTSLHNSRLPAGYTAARTIPCPAQHKSANCNARRLQETRQANRKGMIKRRAAPHFGGHMAARTIPASPPDTRPPAQIPVPPTQFPVPPAQFPAPPAQFSAPPAQFPVPPAQSPVPPAQTVGFWPRPPILYYMGNPAARRRRASPRFPPGFALPPARFPLGLFFRRPARILPPDFAAVRFRPRPRMGLF